MDTGGGTASVFHDPSATTLLARDGAFGTKSHAGTVKLTGLTIGYTYRIQLLGSHRSGDEWESKETAAKYGVAPEMLRKPSRRKNHTESELQHCILRGN